MFTGLDMRVEVKSATRSRSPTSGSSKNSTPLIVSLLQICTLKQLRKTRRRAV